MKRTWALDIANDTPSCVVHEFYTYLCDTSTRTYKWQLLVCVCSEVHSNRRHSTCFVVFASWIGRGDELKKGINLPVRPRTLVTLTSLTSTFEESIFGGF